MLRMHDAPNAAACLIMALHLTSDCSLALGSVTASTHEWRGGCKLSQAAGSISNVTLNPGTLSNPVPDLWP